MALKAKDKEQKDKDLNIDKTVDGGAKKTSKKATDSKTTATKKTTTAKKVAEKKVEAKKTATAKSAKVVKATSVKKTDAKGSIKSAKVEKDINEDKTIVAKAKVKSTKSTTKKSSAIKKDEDKKTVEKKSAPKKSTVAKKTADNKKTTAKKTAAKKSVTKKTTTKKSTTSKISKVKKMVTPLLAEYYDLPYRYNQTVVKVLAQNPNTLFTYWDISDEERKAFEDKYGERFFYITRPVLIVHNLTDNYTYEIEIDDFANNWYIHVNDTKCKYVIELGRRPIEYTQEVPVNYINVAFSNVMEIPNDHVLFFKENDRIYFKNIKTNKITEHVFKSNTYGKKVKELYSNYNLSEIDDKNKFDFNNPSSQNPTSNVL